MSNGERQCSECDFYDPKSSRCRFQPPVFQYIFVPRGQNTGNVQREGGGGRAQDLRTGAASSRQNHSFWAKKGHWTFTPRQSRRDLR
jgi:hypothetical protein